uniref:Ion_trans domain-containing protein n=1 Tax=Macrostomum lignano TaxID=282301 RepID=A0A1I8GG66_9PLAT
MFRSVHFLSLSAVIGPVVAMLWSLLFNDLVPFLAIIGVIIGAFGVFFFNLLFSITGVDTRSAYYNSSWYGWDTFVQAITLPFNILFTNFDKVIFDKSLTNITIGKVAHSQGIGVFENLMMFLFMGLVNIVMLNLLIALFNLRVSRMANEALGIWRKTYFGMLREYQGLSPWPPPLSFIWFIYDFVRGSCKCRKGRKFVRVTQEKAHWWQDESKYPENYMNFLEFQANQLRRIRPRLLLSNFGSNNQQDELAELTEATGAQLADNYKKLVKERRRTI